MSDVDVLILSWNRAEHTVAAIRSALAQSGVSRRVIVVDQHSRAETLDAVRAEARHPDVHLVELATNTGAAGGRNIAARAAGAPWLVFLDNDAVFADDRVLARLGDLAARHPDVALFAFQIRDPDGGNDPRSWVYGESRRGQWTEAFETTKFVGAAFAVRQDAFLHAGGFDPTLFFTREEQELAYRLMSAGHRLRYEPQLAIVHDLAAEANTTWSGERMRLWVRNGVFVEAQYLGIRHTALLAGGWLALAARNGLAAEALRGVAEGVAMLARGPRRGQRVSAPVRATLQRHGSRRRGLRDELWKRL